MKLNIVKCMENRKAYCSALTKRDLGNKRCIYENYGCAYQSDRLQNVRRHIENCKYHQYLRVGSHWKNNSVFANTPEFRDRIWFKLRRFNSPEYKHSADVDNLGIYTLMFFSGGLAYGGQGLFKNSLQVIGGDLYIYTDDDGWTSDSRHRDEFLNLFWYPILKETISDFDYRIHDRITGELYSAGVQVDDIQADPPGGPADDSD